MTNSYKKISQLRKLLKKYNDLYYKKGISEISDYEYDNLLKELESLEFQATGQNLFASHAAEKSPAETIGSDLVEGFTKRKHNKKMLSISNMAPFMFNWP